MSVLYFFKNIFTLKIRQTKIHFPLQTANSRIMSVTEMREGKEAETRVLPLGGALHGGQARLLLEGHLQRQDRVAESAFRALGCCAGRGQPTAREHRAG